MNKYHWLLRAVKIGAAAVTAICVAALLDLNYAVSAGTLAILTIQPTKRETVNTAIGRLIPLGIAFIIAYVCFGLFGCTLPAYWVFLLLFIFVCQRAGWYSSMATNGVLISHILAAGQMGVPEVLNECLIFAIGVGMGVLANLHLRKNVDYMEQLREETDSQMRRILSRMSERILDRDISDYNGDCFIHLRDSIRRAKNVAEENYNNQLFRKDMYDREYILMRERQCHVLYEMYKQVRTIETTPLSAEKISRYLSEVAGSYHKDNTGEELLEKVYQLHEEMKQKPLPVERSEFEDRAKLYTLMRYMEEFIELKADFIAAQNPVEEEAGRDSEEPGVDIEK